MTRTRRKAILAAVLGAAAVAAAVPMVISGTANAQSGSRLCGRYWFSTATRESVTKIYEVEKSDPFTCDWALKEQGPGDSPFASRLKDQNFTGYTDNYFGMVVCEDWKTVRYERGGYKNKTVINPDGSPLADQNDICNNMERSDNLADMERYWLYGSADSPTVVMDRN